MIYEILTVTLTVVGSIAPVTPWYHTWKKAPSRGLEESEPLKSERSITSLTVKKFLVENLRDILWYPLASDDDNGLYTVLPCSINSSMVLSVNEVVESDNVMPIYPVPVELAESFENTVTSILAPSTV